MPAPALRPGPEPATDLDDAAYAAVVARMKEHILAGDIYQVVPSRTFSAPCADPLAAFAALRRLDRSPYMFFVSGPDHLAVRSLARSRRSASAARTIGRSSRSSRSPARAARGADADEDDQMEADLRLDTKEVAEHMMLVDLARNDVARVSAPGTRRVAKLMDVERYARVMHLVSSVKGSLRIGYDAFHALQACLNIGTLSGAPKIKATELLRRVREDQARPLWRRDRLAGRRRQMDSGVIIRSAVVKDGVAYRPRRRRRRP